MEIQDHVDSLRDLELTILEIRGADGVYVDRHALPRCIEKLVAIQQTRYASLALAGQKLQEWGQILRADDLARERSM